MSKITYQWKNFGADSLQVIERANQIAVEYARQGYDLTLRQLYYQFVSRDWLPNNDKSYKRLGNIVNDGRLAGLIDWDHLVDRTRNLASLATWDSPESIIDIAAQGYREDKWASQPQYVEVWVEKEALAGVVARPANRWQVPYFSCRGYVSQSEMHAAAQRIKRQEDEGHKVTVIHLGDHDPSGLDMTRDIDERLYMFGARAKVKRIALNMDQVEAYNPPPNPAKITDSRAQSYIDTYGEFSWELDALDPATLDALIDAEIQDHLDAGLWRQAQRAQERSREALTAVSNQWADVTEWLASQRDDNPEDDE